MTRPNLPAEVWRILAKAHNIRNRSEYEGDFDVDERLLADLISACKKVATAIAKLPKLP